MNVFSTLLAMISRGFSAVTVLFAAAEDVSYAVKSLATVARETAGEYEDKSRSDRIKAAKQLQLDSGVELLQAPVKAVK